MDDTVVGEHYFCIPDADGQPKKAFNATVHLDRNCLWEERKEEVSGFESITRAPDAVPGSFDIIFEADAPTYNSTLSEEDYWDFLELDALSLNQVNNEAELWRAIDDILAPYFWRDVNPTLECGFTRSLARPAATQVVLKNSRPDEKSKC